MNTSTQSTTHAAYQKELESEVQIIVKKPENLPAATVIVKNIRAELREKVGTKNAKAAFNASEQFLRIAEQVGTAVWLQLKAVGVEKEDFKKFLRIHAAKPIYTEWLQGHQDTGEYTALDADDSGISLDEIPNHDSGVSILE